MNTVAKKFRALLAVLVAGVLGVGLTACSSSGGDLLSSGTDSATDTDAESTEAAEPEEAEERSYEEVVEQYVNASFEPDMGAIYELYPDEDLEIIKEYVLLYLEQEYEDFVAAMDEETQKDLDLIDESIGSGWTFSYEIVGDKKASDSSLLQLEILYKGDGVELDISEFRILEVALTITSQDGTFNQTELENVYVVKVGSSWYLVSYMDYDFES